MTVTIPLRDADEGARVTARQQTVVGLDEWFAMLSVATEVRFTAPCLCAECRPGMRVNTAKCQTLGTETPGRVPLVEPCPHPEGGCESCLTFEGNRGCWGSLPVVRTLAHVVRSDDVDWYAPTADARRLPDGPPTGPCEMCNLAHIPVDQRQWVEVDGVLPEWIGLLS